MKRLLSLLLAPLAACAPMLFGQDAMAQNSPSPAAPGEKPLELAPTPGVRMTPTPLDLPLIPEQPAPAETSHSKKSKTPVGPSRTEAAEDALQMRVKMRAAKTKAMEDPVLKEELDRAAAAKTDYAQREAYKRYYVLLYARMLKIDPSIKAGVDQRQALSLYREDQHRVAPTVPPDEVGRAGATR